MKKWKTSGPLKGDFLTHTVDSQRLWGSTVGYPSDSLASCLMFRHIIYNVLTMNLYGLMKVYRMRWQRKSEKYSVIGCRTNIQCWIQYCENIAFGFSRIVSVTMCRLLSSAPSRKGAPKSVCLFDRLSPVATICVASVIDRWRRTYEDSLFLDAGIGILTRLYTDDGFTLKRYGYGCMGRRFSVSGPVVRNNLPLYHQQFVKLTACIRLSASSKHICLHYVFTARCTLVQSAVLRSHVVCLSVRPSVTLVDCDHMCWNLSKIVSRLVSLGCSLSADPNISGCNPRGTPGNLGPKSQPLLIWASETFDRNCGRMVTDIATVTVESL